MYTIQKEKKQPKIIHTELAGILISVHSNNVKLSQLILEITFAYNSLASQKYHSHIKSFISIKYKTFSRVHHNELYHRKNNSKQAFMAIFFFVSDS